MRDQIETLGGALDPALLSRWAYAFWCRLVQRLSRPTHPHFSYLDLYHGTNIIGR
jgi:hypothetical protein